MRSITSAGFTSCICAGSNVQEPIRRFIDRACTTQVDAFWSKSIQKKGMKAKIESTRKTAFTPSTASSGCSVRARSRKRPPWRRLRQALAITAVNECGSRPDGGTLTYRPRPIQKTSVAIPIRMPGIPNATAGPKSRSVLGISIEAKNDPRLMLQ